MFPVLARMERAGIGLDLEALGLARDRVGQIVGETRDIMAEYGVANPNASRQLNKVLYGIFGLKPPLLTDTEAPSSNADAVALLLSQDLAPPIRRFVTALDDYREANKLKTTYIDKLPEQRGSDGRVHTSFLQHVVETGRLSSRDPNLQNLPARTDLGRSVRRAIVPADGMVLVKADFSQLELRIVAALSRDTALLRAYTSSPPLDIHSLTSTQLFGTTEESKRRIAKTANFGVGYGASPKRLSLLLLKEGGLVVPEGECKDIIRRWWAAYSGVKAWRDAEWRRILARGYTQTYFGRRNPIPNTLNPEDWGAVMAAQREALNMPVQGTGADSVKLWMIDLDRSLRERHLQSRMLLQVHDELVLECPPEELDEVCELARTCGEQELEGVPLLIDVKTGPNWVDVH